MRVVVKKNPFLKNKILIKIRKIKILKILPKLGLNYLLFLKLAQHFQLGFEEEFHDLN